MQKIKEYIQSENWKKAFSTSRKFFFGIPKEDMRNIEIAADCLNGKTDFYEKLGVDCNDALEKAKIFLISKYA